MVEKTTATISSYGKNKPAYRTPAPSGAGVHPFACVEKGRSPRASHAGFGNEGTKFPSYENNDELPKLGVSIMDTPKFGRWMIKNIRTKKGREPPRATRAGFPNMMKHMNILRCPAPRKRCGTPFCLRASYNISSSLASCPSYQSGGGRSIVTARSVFPKEKGERAMSFADGKVFICGVSC